MDKGTVVFEAFGVVFFTLLVLTQFYNYSVVGKKHNI